MIRYFVIGLILFLILAISFAPAGLVRYAIPANANLHLLEPRGTVWNGQAQVVLAERNLGRVDWQLQPGSLIALTPAVDWQLRQADAQLDGEARLAAGDELLLLIEGYLDAAALNPWLAQYDIRVPASFDLRDISLAATLSQRFLSSANGSIHWPGGATRYALSGEIFDVVLPPLVGQLQDTLDGPQAAITTQDSSVPLMIVTQTDPGVVKIGLTKRFTKLLNRPWPGSDADHVIVLEVEEALF